MFVQKETSKEYVNIIQTEQFLIETKSDVVKLVDKITALNIRIKQHKHLLHRIKINFYCYTY